MQQLKDNLPSDQPITGLCIVADPAQCPPGYIVIDKSYDKQEDVDLWKDSIFARRVTRYLCITRQLNSGQAVLIDIALTNERDPVPNGFCMIENTQDTLEKATKKKNLCVKFENRNITHESICELIILSKSRRPPNGYTLIGEMNGLNFCYKIGFVPKSTQYQNSSSAPLPYALHGGNYRTQQNSQEVVVSQNSSAPPPRPPLYRESTLARNLALSPLSGIPFELNKKYMNSSSQDQFQVPNFGFKSIFEIEQEFQANFRCEQTAIQARSSP